MKTLKKVLNFLNPLTLYCSIFGHSWIYSFTPADSKNIECNIKRCKVCGNIQHYKKVSNTIGSGVFWSWVDMIIYSKKEAKNTYMDQLVELTQITTENKKEALKADAEKSIGI